MEFGLAKDVPIDEKVSIDVHKQRVKDELYPALEKLGYEYKLEMVKSMFDEKEQETVASGIPILKEMN